MPMLPLALLVLAGADVSVRLPDVSFADGRHLERGKLIAASASVHASRQAGFEETALTLVWDSGEVLWKDGERYRLGKVSHERAALLGVRLQRLDSEARQALTESYLGPDAEYHLLAAAIGPSLAVMKSWHLDVPAGAIATSRGIESLGGRDPHEVRAHDTPAFQAFLRTWDLVEQDLRDLVAQATPSKQVKPAFDWGWRSALRLGRAYELSLVREHDVWAFLVKAPGAAAEHVSTEAELRAFVARQPKGTTLRWDPGCKRLGDEPLLSNQRALDDFTAFCREHGVELTLLPGG